MADVIPWWRQNFIEEYSALASDVVVENQGAAFRESQLLLALTIVYSPIFAEEVSFVGGTEEDRKLTKERVQVCLVAQ